MAVIGVDEAVRRNGPEAASRDDVSFVINTQTMRQVGEILIAPTQFDIIRMHIPEVHFIIKKAVVICYLQVRVV